eukprot:TRINITY_DN9533_c0_g1_i14.p1 TRINITY_DN9533_c0_g1~~TRINITY_DN9533_c0_g1_i14.p1  ORF type:complete len:290 (+),score=83.40 TRINITY_DN9533_c0_g1_i14:268-1137(+)
MSLEAKLRAKYKGQLDSVDDVEELILDELATIKVISLTDKQYLERFVGLGVLSMNYLGLTSLENLPVIPSVTELQLNENAITNGLESLAIYPKLHTLELSNNRISEVKQLEPLKSLKELGVIVLDGCPVTEEESYREEIFKLVPQLKYIDGRDSEGNYVSADSKSSEGEESEESDQENSSQSDDQEDSSAKVVDEGNDAVKEDAKLYNYSGHSLNSVSNSQLQGLEDGFQSLPGLEYQFEGEDYEDHHLGKQDHMLREDFFEDFDGEEQGSDWEGGMEVPRKVKKKDSD